MTKFGRSLSIAVSAILTAVELFPAPLLVQAQGAPDAALTQLLGILRSEGFGALSDVYDRYQPDLAFRDGMYAKGVPGEGIPAHYYGWIDPGQFDESTGRWGIHIRLDTDEASREPYAAGILAHEFEHVWQIYNITDTYAHDCTTAEAGAYRVEGSVLSKIIADYGQPSTGLRDYEAAIVASLGDTEVLRHLAWQYDCTGRQPFFPGDLPPMSLDSQPLPVAAAPAPGGGNLDPVTALQALDPTGHVHRATGAQPVSVVSLPNGISDQQYLAGWFEGDVCKSKPIGVRSSPCIVVVAAGPASDTIVTASAFEVDRRQPVSDTDFHDLVSLSLQGEILEVDYNGVTIDGRGTLFYSRRAAYQWIAGPPARLVLRCDEYMRPPRTTGPSRECNTLFP